MKKILLAAILMLGASGVKAQMLEIINNRTETVTIRMRGECMGTGLPCNKTEIYLTIPATTPVMFPDYSSMLASPYFNSVVNNCPGASALTFQWHWAEIQNVGSSCAGAGVAVGDGMCSDPITTLTLTPGPWCYLTPPPSAPCASQYCANWITLSPTFDRVVIYQVP